ncbi:hypothetical protein AGMMS49957_01730 [Synergistales bacterium]|nr:hypothetical protein AGMMS49957_01730 [Synergistales bacterium]
MSLLPLFTVEQIYYPALMVLMNQSYNAKQYLNPELSITSKLGKIPHKRNFWGIRLDIKTPDDLDSTTFPYTFAVSIYGRFQCDMPEPIEKETYLKKRKLIYVNGSTMLYSAARDRLLLLTNASYCLPAYRFNPDDIR